MRQERGPSFIPLLGVGNCSSQVHTNCDTNCESQLKMDEKIETNQFVITLTQCLDLHCKRANAHLASG